MTDNPAFSPEVEDGGIVLSLTVPSLPRVHSAPNMAALPNMVAPPNGSSYKKHKVAGECGNRLDKHESGGRKEERTAEMEMSRSELARKYRLHVFVAAIFVVTLTSVSLSWYYRNLARQMLQSSQTIFFDPRTRLLRLLGPSEVTSTQVHLGLDMPRWQLPLHCPVVMGDNPHAKDCVWKEHAMLTLTHFGDAHVQCYNVSWRSLTHKHVPYDCLELGHAHWYGPSNQSQSIFPIRGSFVFQPDQYTVGGNGIFSHALDFYWLSSSGAALFVRGDNPIQIQWNRTGENRLCLLSNYTGALYTQASALTSPLMNYTLCQGTQPASTHAFMRSMFPKITFPPHHALHDSYWSLQGSKGGANVTQQDLLDLIGRVGSRGGSSVSVDGDWQKYHGDLTFDPKVFPNLTEVKEAVEGSDLRLTLTVNPYFQYQSRNFHTGVERSLFVNDAGGHVTGLTAAQGGTSAALNVFKPESRAWFTGKLQTLRSELGLSAFRLTYGQAGWLPYKPHFGHSHATPDMYRRLMAESVSSAGETLVLDHTSSSQHVPALLPVHTRTKVKEGQECIVDVLETAFTLGLMGYPFLMADGVSGQDGQLPGRDVYIRWLQLSSFFPARQFSFPPWRYDQATQDAADNATYWRAGSVTQALLGDAVRDDTERGVPLLRPVWWAESGNLTLHHMEVKDEFLVGPDLLVAPVLCGGQRSRDVYLPAGIWEDSRDGTFFQGPTTLTDYPVPLEQVGLFVRRTVRGHNREVEL
ncbi:myogenesis-regulating glycosidase [Aplysia californica]|uniref:Myogenesis-regulating glycosidase n=1 Tax=Aplysia californica TaxID=6500 RepID=A0ABM0ZZM1_APLCA|nr:myogenesis-regulating glycosidase [Aplysia californica]